ncbi:hypothetical protein P153DRAFT_292948, partial [Dothidotthia symphoricarpi CBS 119687]
APAKDVIEYEARAWDLDHIYLGNGTMNPEKKGHFNGKPTPELAAEWKELLQHQNFRLQKEDFGPFANDENLVQLSDKSGYFATIAVYHGLHCLKRFHHYLYQDEYYPDMSADDKRRLLFHAATDKAQHQCVAWKPLEHWAAERAFNAFEPGLLVHPTFGKLLLAWKRVGNALILSRKVVWRRLPR